MLNFKTLNLKAFEQTFCMGDCGCGVIGRVVGGVFSIDNTLTGIDNTLMGIGAVTSWTVIWVLVQYPWQYPYEYCGNTLGSTPWGIICKQRLEYP